MDKKDSVIHIRRFILLDELTKSDKGKLEGNISYGLQNPTDRSFTKWNGSIITDEGRFYELSIITGPSYPVNPPSIQFKSKVNMPSVNQSNGLVDFNKVSGLKKWNSDMRIETCLLALKEEIKKYKGHKQPAEGETY